MRAVSFPKIRPALPENYRAIYEAQYLSNRSGDTCAASLSQKLEAIMHRWLASDAAADKATLEIGAGTLNQLEHELPNKAYDIVEPQDFLYQRSPARERVREAFYDIGDVPPDRRYARITSCAALEHVCDLPDMVHRAAGLLAADGVFKAAIPSEGGFLWWLGWRLTTGLEFRFRHGLDYGVLMKHEHVNTALEVEAVIRDVFPHVKVRSVGFGRQLSLYRLIEAHF